MTYQEPFLSSSAINTGSAVTLKGMEISFSHKNNIKAPDFPAKFTTSQVVGSVDFIGYENPVVQISGVFDEKVTPRITLLKSFAKETSSVYLYDPLFFSTPHLVQISNLSMSRKANEGFYQSDSTQIKGSIVTYSIDAVLTE